MTFSTGPLQLVEKEGLYSLTDLWKKAGEVKDKAPSQWTRNKTSREFIDYISKSAKMHSPIKTIYNDGRNEVFAHWQIVLAYAKFISHEFHAEVNQVFKERQEENQNPELGINRSHERAINNYKKQGKDDKWIKNRMSGIETRHYFTDTLSSNGCDGQGIAICTNNIYREVIGGTAKDIRSNRGISRKSSIRDSLTMTENLSNALAESLATDKIESEDLKGNNQCANACKKAGQEVKKAVDGVLKQQIKG